MSEKDFEKYFKRYYTPLGMYVLRICGNVSETEDIVQEVFSIVWQKLEDERVPDNFKAYIYRVAHNLTIDRLRRQKTAATLVTLDSLGDSEPTEEDIDTSERDARLWNAIGNLPAKCREIFLLSKRDGLSNARIAQELDISVKTVENQITKAFKSLRSSLQPKGKAVFFLPFL